MAFVKKIWKDRISEYPNRRTINDGNFTKVVTVGRDEGNITQAGDALNAANFNDLEDRIEAGFGDVYTKEETNEVIDDALKDVYPLGEASGDIASFNTGVILPLKSCEVDINPVQNLHGYSKPWAGGTGKNKFSYTGSISGSGTVLNKQTINQINQGSYVLSIGSASTRGTYVSFTFWDSSDNSIGSVTIQTSQTSGTLTLSGNATKITVYTPDTCNIVNVQIESGSSATSYAPYENDCPISGHTQADIVVCGKNRLNVADKTTTGGSYIINNEYVPMVAGYYVLSFDFSGTSNSSSLRIDDENGTAIFTTTKTITSGHNEYLLNLPSKGAFVKLFSNADGTYSKFQIEQGNQFTAYEPYKGNLYNIPFGQTVYIGKLNATTGVLTILSNIVSSLKNLIWIYNSTFQVFYANLPTDALNKLSVDNSCCELYAPTDKTLSTATWTQLDNGTYVMAANLSTSGRLALVIKDTKYANATDFSNSLTDKKFVYPLATPILVQLTPTEIRTLLEQNNIYSDTGEIDVIYHHALTAKNIYFDNSGTTLMATNVEDAIKEVLGRI